MSDSGVKIEVHLIQHFAPSNLNRDDTGQPKSAFFGGFRRARVSSQCGKRALRDWWRERSTVTVGDRTKRLQKMIYNKLDLDTEFMKTVPDKEHRRAGIRVFTDAYYAVADKKKSDHTSVLIFISPGEVDVCVQAVKDLWKDRNKEITKKGKQTSDTIKGIESILKEIRDFDATNADQGDTAADLDTNDMLETKQETVTAALEGTSDKTKARKPKLNPEKEIEEKIQKAKVSADIALFGRMLAEQPQRNTHAACQVAHPISTHKVDMEMDFYTAVDDLNPAEETGAGMMGVVGFNSACYYRYALVDRDQLARNLARKTERKNGTWAQELVDMDYQEADSVIRAFLEGMVYAIPAGKQNSFAAQNLPLFGLFVRRQGGVPISLANAFAKPVRPTRNDDDLVGLSVAALTKHWNALMMVYGEQGVKAMSCFHLGQESRLNGVGKSAKGSVKEAIDAVMEAAIPK